MAVEIGEPAHEMLDGVLVKTTSHLSPHGVQVVAFRAGTHNSVMARGSGESLGEARLSAGLQREAISLDYTVALDGGPVQTFDDPAEALTKAQAEKRGAPEMLVTIIVDDATP